MKAGEKLNQEDYLFWRLVHYFVSDNKYRIVQVSKDQNEIWLEKVENKAAQIIRIFRYDLDWSNWLMHDIEQIAMKGEAIRKQIRKGNLNLLNLYVTVYPPVDDYEFRIQDPFLEPKRKKTAIHTKVVDSLTYKSKLQELGNMFHSSISIPSEPDISTEDVEELRELTFHEDAKQKERDQEILTKGKPFFTYIFILIQIGVFLIMELNGGSTNTSTLIHFGAKFNPLILEGEWWRFFTPMVLHIGLLHLVTNTIALYYLGTEIEKIFGRFRFLFIYLFAGFSGSLASFLFSSNLSAGASGAIFGCFGALLFFGLIHPQLFYRTMGFNVLTLLVINLIFGFTVPGIDNAGHIGGLIGGFLAAGIVYLPGMRKIIRQAAFLVLSVLLTGFLLQYGYGHPEAVTDEQSVLILSQEYIQSEKFEEAYSLLTSLGSNKSHSAEYYFFLSYTEIKLDKIHDAEEHLINAIEIKPDLHEAHYNLALIYLEQGRTDKAKEHIEKALEADPDNADYKKLLNQLKSRGVNTF